MPAQPRVLAAAAAVCLLAAIAAAVLLPRSGQHRSSVRLRSLSSTDVLAIPTNASTTAVDRVVVLGDSVGTDAGCGCRPFGPRLGQLLAARLRHPVRVASLARDGQTSSGLVDQLDADAQTEDQVRAATAVTVVIGANDFDADAAGTACAGSGTTCFNAALSALSAALDHALARIRSLAGPKVRVLLLGYWNVFLDGDVAARQGTTYRETSAALTRRVDAVLQQGAASAQATYVDLDAAFHAGGAGDDTPLLAPDGDHPSAAGHQRIAELLAGYLAVAAG